MELKIETRNVELRKGWQERIEEEKSKLIRHYANLILHLRVVIEATPHHKEGGFEVRLVSSVPGDTVVVSKTGVGVRTALVEAFDVLTLKLKEMVRKKRDSQQSSDVGSDTGGGVIKKLSPYESYGFIIAPDGKEIYFHENSLKGIDMDQLTEGDEVIFGETDGDKGPQASWVRKAA